MVLVRKNKRSFLKTKQKKKDRRLKKDKQMQDLVINKAFFEQAVSRVYLFNLYAQINFFFFLKKKIFYQLKQNTGNAKRKKRQ